eukprot:gene537-788_t
MAYTKVVIIFSVSTAYAVRMIGNIASSTVGTVGNIASGTANRIGTQKKNIQTAIRFGTRLKRVSKWRSLLRRHSLSSGFHRLPASHVNIPQLVIAVQDGNMKSQAEGNIKFNVEIQKPLARWQVVNWRDAISSSSISTNIAPENKDGDSSSSVNDDNNEDGCASALIWLYKAGDGFDAHLVLDAFTDEQLDFYLPQLVMLAVMKGRSRPTSLSKFLIEKAQGNIIFALKLSRYLQSIVDDDVPELKISATALLADSKKTILTSNAWFTCRNNIKTIRQKISKGRNFFERSTKQQTNEFLKRAIQMRSFSDKSVVAKHVEHASKAIDHLHELSTALDDTIKRETEDDRNIFSTVLKRFANPSSSNLAFNTLDCDNNISSSIDADHESALREKQMKACYNTFKHFIAILLKLSKMFVGAEKQEKCELLHQYAHAINQVLFERRLFVTLVGQPFSFLGLSLPIFQGDTSTSHANVVKVHMEDCKFFSSRTASATSPSSALAVFSFGLT